ncbi:hypothetical protein HGA91_05920 [candidate division WWE3 bacterium]|nr:hypothetical protein [candidate division WWE3 bacterium]
MKAKFELKLQKRVLQINYRPTLEIFGERAGIGSVLENRYGEWQTNTHGDIVLYTPSDKTIFNITAGMISSISEGDYQIESAQKDCNDIWEHIVTISPPKEIRRLGTRIVSVYASNFKFEELVSILQDSLYSQNEKLVSITAGVTDLAFVLDQREGEYKKHLQIGPLRHTELERYFKPNFDVEDGAVKDANLFIDLDIGLTKDIEPNNTIEKLQESAKIAESTLNSYFEYLNTGK